MMEPFWVFLFLVTNLRVSTAVTQKCCRNEQNLIVKNKCAPNETGVSWPINLTCGEKYVLDPNYFEDDAFNITANGSLNVLGHTNGVLIPPEEFCIVNQHPEEESGEVGELHEIAVVCFPEVPEEISMLTFTVKAIMIFTSVFFLLLTLYVYYRLPELRETQDKVTSFTLITLTIFLFSLGIMQLQTPLDITVGSCLTLAFSVYFFTMAYFAWLNCVIFCVWKSVILRYWKISEQLWYIMNHIYAWFVPTWLTIIVAIKHVTTPTLGVSTCWFHHDRDQWRLVYLPISIMLALNAVFCLWTSLGLMRDDFSPDSRKALRYKCQLYLKLFLLGGFTWIFEVLSYFYNDHAPSAWIWMIVDSLNCLHGVLVFFVLVVWRKRIKKELSGKLICGYRCPAKWADVEDDEVCLDNEGKRKYDLIIHPLK